MPRGLSLLVAVSFTFVLVGCSQGSGDSASESPTDEHAGHGMADQSSDAGDAPAAELSNYVPASYPLETCVVGGGDLDGMGGAVSFEHEGRTVWFCCDGCEADFKADPDTYLKMVDDAVVAQQSATYPLDTCLISGDELGDEPIDYVYENRLVRLCCEMCIGSFLKNPDAYLAKLNEAVIAEQMADYPISTCPIAGGPLGGMGKPVDMVVGDRLVRLCCAGCEDAVREDPAGTLAKVYGSEEAPTDE